MSIYTQIILIILGYVIGFGIIVAQVLALMRLHPIGLAWSYLSAAFVLMAGLQVWGFVRLASTVMEAQAKGVMPSSLTWEQWIRVVVIYAIIGLFILHYDKLRRNLRVMGI